MSQFLPLGKFSFGMGDRFAHQGKAQLRACIRATELGALFVPVWNKSNREHTFVGSDPSSTRAAADAAVRELGWNKPYHVDADHIRLETVDRFIPYSDFYTIDVADSIGKPAGAADVKTFVDRHPELIGTISIPHIDQPFAITRAEVERVANTVFSRRAGRGKNLPAHRQGQGRGKFHHRSFDGRNRQSADAAGIARHSRRDCRPENSDPDRRAESSPAVSTRAWITSAT